jgi:hypothetical protein
MKHATIWIEITSFKWHPTGFVFIAMMTAGRGQDSRRLFPNSH